jgi:hypothetical protein
MSGHRRPVGQLVSAHNTVCWTSKRTLEQHTGARYQGQMPCNQRPTGMHCCQYAQPILFYTPTRAARPSACFNARPSGTHYWQLKTTNMQLQATQVFYTDILMAANGMSDSLTSEVAATSVSLLSSATTAQNSQKRHHRRRKVAVHSTEGCNKSMRNVHRVNLWRGASSFMCSLRDLLSFVLWRCSVVIVSVCRPFALTIWVAIGLLTQQIHNQDPK